jgi:hypothetical protein
LIEASIDASSSGVAASLGSYLALISFQIMFSRGDGMGMKGIDLQCPEHPMAAFLVSIRSLSHDLVVLLHFPQQFICRRLCDLK